MEQNLIKNERNVTLDVYKGILILFVVIRHVLQYSCKDEGGLITNFIWSIQMPGFMFVSGFFAYKSISSHHDVIKTLKKNIQHYLLPFITWYLIINVLFLGQYDRNFLQAIKTIIYRVDIGLWFLWVIFVLQSITVFFNYLISKYYNKGIILSLVGLVVFYAILFLLFYFVKNINFLGIKLILYYSIFFFSGFLINYKRVYFNKLEGKYNTIISLICFLVYFFLILNFDLYRCNDDFKNIFIRIICAFSGCYLLLVVCRVYSEKLEKKGLSRIGKMTIEVYVTHMYVNNLFISNMQETLFSWQGCLLFFISLISTFLLTFIIIKIINVIPGAKFLFFGKK